RVLQVDHGSQHEKGQDRVIGVRSEEGSRDEGVGGGAEREDIGRGEAGSRRRERLAERAEDRPRRDEGPGEGREGDAGYEVAGRIEEVIGSVLERLRDARGESRAEDRARLRERSREARRGRIGRGFETRKLSRRPGDVDPRAVPRDQLDGDRDYEGG